MASIFKSWFEQFSRYPSGYDIFISYSRADASAYALGLAEQLQRIGLVCAVDQMFGSGPNLPDRLRDTLLKSSMLVVVATEGAAKSEKVGQEVDEFIEKTKRVVIPINVGGALERAQWFHLVVGVQPALEKVEALSLGEPSSEIIRQIGQLFKYSRRRQRQRRVYLGFTLATAILTIIVSLFLSSEVKRFVVDLINGPTPTPSPYFSTPTPTPEFTPSPTPTSTPKPTPTPAPPTPTPAPPTPAATPQTTPTVMQTPEVEPSFFRKVTPSLGWLVALVLFAALLLNTRQLRIGSFVVGSFGLGSFGDFALDWIYGRVTVSKFYRRYSLRNYQRALLKQNWKLSAPFKAQSPAELREFYVRPKLHSLDKNESLEPVGAMLDYRPLVILGAPGSGKTTLLRFLTQTFAAGGFRELPDEPVPVLIEIHNRPSPEQDLTKHVRRVLTGSGFPEGDTFMRYLRQGKFILLFDGLDEVEDEDRRRWVSGIQDLAHEYPRCRFIITCRRASYGGEFDAIGARRFEIVEFDDQQIRQFLTMRLARTPLPSGARASAPVMTVEQLMRLLSDRPRLMALARNPLMLTLIAELYFSGRLLPTRSMAEFYKQAVEVLLKGWTNEPSQFNVHDKRAVLQEIAFHISGAHTSPDQHLDRRSIRSEEAFEVAARVLESRRLSGNLARRILEEIAERSGLLVTFEGGEAYQFGHLSVQEFFTAERLLLNDPDVLLRRYINDPSAWRVVVGLWCGMASNAGELIRKLHHYDPVFALACLADAPKVDPAVADDIIKSAEGSFCDGAGDAFEKERAFGAVASSDHPFSKEVFDFLKSQFEEAGDAGCRVMAARALAYTQSGAAAEVLMRHYTDVAEVRSILVGMGDVAVPAFATLVKEVREGSVQALEDLRLIGTATALETLTALVPLIGERLETLQQEKSSLKIEFSGRTGFYLNRDETLGLRVTNLGAQPIKDLVIELEDTAKYMVHIPPGERGVKLERLGAGESEEITYPIRVTQLGQVTLQLRVSGGVYKDALLEITSVNDNPYYFGPPVSNAQDFFGRENELQATLDNTMRPGGAHTMIIGEQRSGKTSLLFQVRNRLTTPYLPIYISFSGVEREVKPALNWLLHRITEELKKGGHLEGKSPPAPLEFASDFTARLAEIMEGLNEKTPGCRLVILLDEAHLMNKIGEQFQEVLRETFAQYVEEVRAVLACYYDFFDDLRSSSSPLHNIFEFIFLKPLAGDDLRNLIVEPAERFGYKYEPVAIEAVTDISGGHPYYCQYVCARSYAEAEKEGRTTISREHVEAARRHVLSTDKQKFQIGYWDNLRPEERLFLKQLVSGASTRNVSRDVLNRLVNKFVIKETKGQYAFTASLFEDWVRRLVREQM